MFLQSHSVNTPIVSCAINLLQQEESQSQSEKIAQCERAFNILVKLRKVLTFKLKLILKLFQNT